MDYKFSKAELADFKRFWEGEIGKKYIKKMKKTKEQLLEVAMKSLDRDQGSYHAAVANGIDSILLDIKATIENVDKTNEEEKTAKEAVK